MAYYSGQAASYDDLKDALVNACVDQGWTWANSILSKDTTFVQIGISTEESYQQGPGLTVLPGTGKTGSTLDNPHISSFRIGVISNLNTTLNIVFPVAYHVFVFNNPNEVYLVVKYSIDRFLYLGFGMSTIPDCGIWCSASFGARFMTNTIGSQIQINATSGGQTSSTSYTSTSGFFWQTLNTPASSYIYYQNATQVVYTDIDGLGWSTSSTDSINVPAQVQLNPLIARLPSNWSDSSPLLPIQPVLERGSNKVSILADIQNARYLRIDNYEPEQIITIGSDRWMILPFHRKNSAARDGGSGIEHTGTFGWAIRYDGP